MFIKKITYKDFAGETRTEEYMFNMSKSDVVQWRYSVNGGIEEVFRRIIDKNDQTALMAMVKDLIRRSYGERSLDGKSFVKRKNGVDLIEEFEQTAAYDALFMELITNSKAAAEFLNGLMPPDLVAELDKYRLADGQVDMDALTAAHTG